MTFIVDWSIYWGWKNSIEKCILINFISLIELDARTVIKVSIWNGWIDKKMIEESY